MPYQGTSGWSGTETSKARAEFMTKFGMNVSWRSVVMALVRAAGVHGMTCREAEENHLPPPPVGPHHGTVSGTFSNLFQDGELVRLTEVRGGNKVYVAPEFVEGRETEKYVPQSAALRKQIKRQNEQVAMLVAYLDCTDPDWRKNVVSVLSTNQGDRP